MDKLLNLSFEKNTAGFEVFFLKDNETNTKEIINGVEIEYVIRYSPLNNSNILKLKSLYPKITEKENQYVSLINEFKDITAVNFYKEYKNKINNFLFNLLERIDSLYWKQKSNDNYITSQYTLDECIRMAIPPSEMELDLILKVFDMKNPFKYQQVKIDENIEKDIETRKKVIGTNIVKQFKKKSKK